MSSISGAAAINIAQITSGGRLSNGDLRTGRAAASDNADGVTSCHFPSLYIITTSFGAAGAVKRALQPQ